MKVVAVIPAFNEEKRIRKVITETMKYVNKVIVIDDGSRDKTTEISKKAELSQSIAKLNVPKQSLFILLKRIPSHWRNLLI